MDLDFHPGGMALSATAQRASDQCACPACGGARATGVRAVPDHEHGVSYVAQYAQCATCASEYQVPMPTPRQLSAWYPDTYHRIRSGGALQQIRHDIRVRRLQRLLATTEGAILDYGCGDGSFLLRAAAKLPGRTFVGFDIADHHETVSAANGAVTLVKGQLSDLLSVLPPCALITMNHVIEHLPSPLDTLRLLAERLLPGGVVEGQTPAAGSLEQAVFGACWSGYHAPRHTVVFSAQGVRRILERAGFSRVTVEGTFNPAGLALSLASTVHGQSPGCINRRGGRWLALLAAATALSPIDLLSRRPAVVNFAAVRVP